MEQTDFFSCECCGECCRGGMMVFLNPRDLILIANYLKFNNTESLFSEGYAIIDRARGGAPLPRIRFRKGIMEFCPFLENSVNEAGRISGKCLLHPHYKPLVCTLAPLAREIDLGLEAESWEVKPPLPGCPGGGLMEECPPEPDSCLEPRIRARLDEERKFFMALSVMLDERLPEREIRKRLYYIRTDHWRT